MMCTSHTCTVEGGDMATISSWGVRKALSWDESGPQIYEETGLDAREMIDQDEYLEAKLSGRKAKMFVVKGVSEESLLAPRSLKEIKVSLLP